MRIAILWTQLSGYMNSALRALAEAGGDLLVIHEMARQSNPFGEAAFSWIRQRRQYTGEPDSKVVLDALSVFQPELIVACWHVRAYQTACRHFRKTAARVGCADNQWQSTFRQNVGRLLAPIYLHGSYDAFFVPGERQCEWARKMGFVEERIWRGLYTCDAQAFDGSVLLHDGSLRAFIYVGRLSHEKGVQVLARAYRSYRTQSLRLPWPLIVVGDGPLRGEIAGAPGVDWRGFVQPAALPAVFAEASCFVIASTFEPWCVAMHEAASAGLPLIATSACGAAVHLLQDGHNGRVVSPHSVDSLTAAMAQMARAPAAQLAEMGRRSAEMSKQFSPERFANTVLERGNDLLSTVGRRFVHKRLATRRRSDTRTGPSSTDASN